MNLRFGRFELESTERRLLADGRPVAIGARAFDLLLALIERRDRLVTKDELLDLVWPGLVVEEANLPVQISSLRKAIGPHVVATIRGLGYRFAMRIDGDHAEFNSARQAAGFKPRSNLPQAPDALFGREHELQVIPDWFASCRLVTIVGAGGVGKTTVAQAAARACTDMFSDGVWWIDLAAWTHEQDIAPTVAAAVQLQLAEGDAPSHLVRALAGKQALLVLDNCEHLADPVAALVRSILTRTSSIRILATSQVSLKVDGERLYRLGSLPVPPPGASLEIARGHPAVRLLEHRARSVDPLFRVSEANVANATDICRQLDGVPLAIEMAAAWLPVMGAAGLHERLEGRIGMLRNLTRRPPPRQQTLRATLDWSHALLDADEAVVLRRLAVFGGSLSLEATQAAAAGGELAIETVLESLAGLVDKSLVKVESSEPPRYRLAETIRLYGLERLRDADELESASDWRDATMCRLAAAAESSELAEAKLLELYGPDYDEWSQVFDRAVERRDAEVAAATVRVLRLLDQARGVMSSARRRVHAAHDLLPLGGPWARARLCSFVAGCGWVGGGRTARFDLAREAVRLWRGLDAPQELHHALALLGTEAARAGAFDAAQEAAAEALRMENPNWPPLCRARRALHAGWTASILGDASHYREAMAEAIVLFELAGAPRLATLSRLGLCDAAALRGDLGEAIALGRATVKAMTELRQAEYLAGALSSLAHHLLAAGELAEARSTVARALPFVTGTDRVILVVDPLGIWAALTGHLDAATRLRSYVDAWRRRNESRSDGDGMGTAARADAAIEAQLDPAARQRLRASGARMSESEALSLASALLG